MASDRKEASTNMARIVIAPAIIRHILCTCKTFMQGMFAKAPRDARPMELHTPESIFYIKISIFNTKMNDRLVIKFSLFL